MGLRAPLRVAAEVTRRNEGGETGHQRSRKGWHRVGGRLRPAPQPDLALIAARCHPPAVRGHRDTIHVGRSDAAVQHRAFQGRDSRKTPELDAPVRPGGDNLPRGCVHHERLGFCRQMERLHQFLGVRFREHVQVTGNVQPRDNVARAPELLAKASRRGRKNPGMPVRVPPRQQVGPAVGRSRGPTPPPRQGGHATDGRPHRMYLGRHPPAPPHHPDLGFLRRDEQRLARGIERQRVHLELDPARPVGPGEHMAVRKPRHGEITRAAPRPHQAKTDVRHQCRHRGGRNPGLPDQRPIEHPSQLHPAGVVGDQGPSASVSGEV